MDFFIFCTQFLEFFILKKRSIYNKFEPIKYLNFFPVKSYPQYPQYPQLLFLTYPQFYYPCIFTQLCYTQITRLRSDTNCSNLLHLIVE